MSCWLNPATSRNPFKFHWYSGKQPPKDQHLGKLEGIGQNSWWEKGILFLLGIAAFRTSVYHMLNHLSVNKTWETRECCYWDQELSPLCWTVFSSLASMLRSFQWKTVTLFKMREQAWPTNMSKLEFGITSQGVSRTRFKSESAHLYMSSDTGNFYLNFSQVQDISVFIAWSMTSTSDDRRQVASR